MDDLPEREESNIPWSVNDPREVHQWWIKNRFIPAIPYIILIGVFTVFGALAFTDATPEHEDFVVYPVMDISQYPDAGEWYMFTPDHHTLKPVPGTIPIKAFVE